MIRRWLQHCVKLSSHTLQGECQFTFDSGPEYLVPAIRDPFLAGVARNYTCSFCMPSKCSTAELGIPPKPLSYPAWIITSKQAPTHCLIHSTTSVLTDYEISSNAYFAFTASLYCQAKHPLLTKKRKPHPRNIWAGPRTNLCLQPGRSLRVVINLPDAVIVLAISICNVQLSSVAFVCSTNLRKKSGSGQMHDERLVQVGL